MATFGKTSNGANTQTFSGDRLYMSQGTPATSGTITQAKGRCWVSAAASPGCRAALYSDNAGVPDVPLARSDEVIISNTTEAEITFPFSGADAISITAGTPYWIGFLFDDPGTPNFTMSRDNTAGQVHFMAATYPTAPNPFVSAGTSNGPIDMFVEYTEAGGTRRIFNVD